MYFTFRERMNACFLHCGQLIHSAASDISIMVCSVAWRGEGATEAQKSLHVPFILFENDERTFQVEGDCSYCRHLWFILDSIINSASSPLWTYHWIHTIVIILDCEQYESLALSHSAIVHVTPQPVTQPSVEQKVVVFSQKACGWRRLQTSRFTPKELAPESSKLPSRDQVGYTEESKSVFAFATRQSLLT